MSYDVNEKDFFLSPTAPFIFYSVRNNFNLFLDVTSSRPVASLQPYRHTKSKTV